MLPQKVAPCNFLLMIKVNFVIFCSDCRFLSYLPSYISLRLIMRKLLLIKCSYLKIFLACPVC